MTVGKLLRIHQEDCLPVYLKLGDIRSRAVTLGQIADIYQARGQLDEALRIRQEDCLPVYLKLGDIHSRAVSLGQIADIYQARGQLDEALRIHQEGCLPDHWLPCCNAVTTLRADSKRPIPVEQWLPLP